MAVKAKLVQGADGTAIPAGFAGEKLSATGTDVATNTSGLTTIATLTLTVGVWSVSACSNSRAAASQTGAVHTLKVKGTGGTTDGKDKLQCPGQPAGSAHSVTFATQRVTIASGDADKTVLVQQQSYTAAGLGCAHIEAICIA